MSHPYYQIGTGTVLYNAIGASFLRHMAVGPALAGPGGGSVPDMPWGVAADSLMAAAVACCPDALSASTELGLLFHLGRSGDPELRRIGQTAGEALLARRPAAVLPRFHLAVSLVQSGHGGRAAPILESLMDDPAAPAWLRGWATYLRAEQLADDDPERAVRLLRGVLDRGVDESGLLAEARALLTELER